MALANNEMAENRFHRWAVARKKLAWINARLSEKRTVYISTSLHHTKVTPRTAASWAKTGDQLFKATKTGLYIRAGKRWDCIDFCKITAQ